MNRTIKLIAAAILALPMGLQAQISRLNFEDIQATTTPYKEVSLDDGNGFKVDAKTDRANSAIEKNNSINFAYSVNDENVEWSPTNHWKPDAALEKDGRTMTITVPSAGKLNIYARNASNSTDNQSVLERKLTITQNSSQLYNSPVNEKQKFQINNKDCYPIISVEVQAGTITVNTTGNINFYGFAFTPTAANVTIGEAKYATFANNTVGTLALPEGVKAYGVSAINDGNVTFTEYNVIPAGVGVILSGNAGTYTLTPTDTQCSYSDKNYMVAVTADQTVAEKANGMLNYIFANKTKGVGFYKSSGTGTITKGKAYLAIPDESADNRSWDFTARQIWSDATIANLEVERKAATSWTTNAGGDDAGWRYMYNVATTTEEITANGEKITELEGLFFRGNANRLGIDNRSTNRFYLAGNKFFVVIPDLKAGSTVTISTKSSTNGENYAYMTCDDTDNVERSGSKVALEVDNVFTINAFGSYEFQANRALYITKITVNYGGSSLAARAFIGLFDNTPTGISTTESKNVTDGQWYTLGGMRIDKPNTKGIYVRDGKKFIVK